MFNFREEQAKVSNVWRLLDDLKENYTSESQYIIIIITLSWSLSTRDHYAWVFSILIFSVALNMKQITSGAEQQQTAMLYYIYIFIAAALGNGIRNCNFPESSFLIEIPCLFCDSRAEQQQSK